MFSVHRPSPAARPEPGRDRAGQFRRTVLHGLLCLSLLAALCAGVLLGGARPVTAAGPGADSPTGRNPRILWTPEQQGVWNRMRAENHPWWRLLKRNADLSGTPNARYGDYGQWGTLAYQMTGDPAYAQKAWHQITHGLDGASFLGTAGVPTRNGNFTREYMMDFVWMYDWLYPVLTPQQRALYVETLNYWSDALLGKAPAYIAGNGQPVFWYPAYGDSDNIVGHYFGIVLWALTSRQENPRADALLNDPAVGGLDVTSQDRETNHRNALASYIPTSEGGVWIESKEYNNLTLRLLFQGAEAVRMLTGRDPYPEISRFQRQTGYALLQDLTPDLANCYEWGDIEHIRSIHPHRRMTLTAILAGMMQQEPLGAYLHQVTEEVRAKYPGESDAWPPFFLFYNPYAAQADWRGQLPAGHYAPGVGLSYFHDGWGAKDSLFGAHMVARTYVHHEVMFFGNFQLWRKGEWAVTNPQSYQIQYGNFANAMLIGGLSSMRQARGPVAQEFGPNNEYSYLAGTTAGEYYDQPYWNPPPKYLNEWSRSTFYLPSADKRSDTILVFDRVDALNPKSLGSVDRYHQWDREQVQNAPALKQWFLHATTQPSATANGAAWTTPGGQQVRLTTLLPAGARQKIVNSDELWPDQWGYPKKSEQKWQVQVTPTQDQQWDTFLNVVQASDPSAGLENTLVQSAGGEAEGVVVRRAGHPDTVVLFGAAQGERVLRSGYAVNWNSGQPRTELYLLDLDPRTSWTATVDGGPAALTVSGQGVGHLTLTGGGDHSLRLTAGGQSSDTTPPSAPSGLQAAAGNAKVDLSWDANSEADLAGYLVYRSESPDAGWARQASTPLSLRQLTQTNVANGKTYWYRLCAVDTSGNESAPCQPVNASPQGDAQPTTFSISGRVTVDGSPAADVAVSAGSQSAATAADGSYTLAGLAAGSYLVTAAKSGLDFGAGQSLTVGPDAVNVSFSATTPAADPNTFSVSGRATVDGAPVDGVKVGWYSADGRTVFTGADGSYRLDGFAPGAYTVWASKEGYAFEPVQVELGPSRTGVDFRGQVTFKVGGRVTVDGAPAAGVKVGWYGASGRAVETDVDGRYELGGFIAGTYTLLAEKTGLSFEAQSVTVGPSRADVNFQSVTPKYVIAGRVVRRGRAVSGAVVSVRNTRLRTATRADGSYLFKDLPAGTYTLVVTRRGYQFPSRRVTVGPSQQRVTIAGR